MSSVISKWSLDDLWMISGWSLDDLRIISGWSVDDLWTISGRSLDALLTLSGRSLDALWTISGRTLDDLSTNSGRSLDDLWMISGWSLDNAIVGAALWLLGVIEVHYTCTILTENPSGEQSNLIILSYLILLLTCTYLCMSCCAHLLSLSLSLSLSLMSMTSHSRPVGYTGYWTFLLKRHFGCHIFYDDSVHKKHNFM